MRRRYQHQLRTAFQAFHFLLDHPKLCVPSRHEITQAEYVKLRRSGISVSKDRCGKCYKMTHELPITALETNLDVWYTKTNGKGRIEDDKTRNIHDECWLEFGELKYDYHTHDPKTNRPYDWDKETSLIHYHDPRLDCGGPTFDEALVKLARLVRKYYGDYRADN